MTKPTEKRGTTLTLFPRPRNQCRHYNITAAPELGKNWLRCLDCGHVYDALVPKTCWSKKPPVE